MRKQVALILLLGSVTVALLTAAMRQNDPKPLSLAEFNRRTGDKTKTVFVYFHADWCVPCVKMGPVMHDIDSLYRSRLEILSIDTERDREVAEALEIDALPAFRIYKNGCLEWGRIGLMSRKELTGVLNSYVPLPPQADSKKSF